MCITCIVVVGRLCKSVETANSFLVLERCGDFQEFQETLNSFCSFGQPGKLEWTPDDNTPDIVYYQASGGYWQSSHDTASLVECCETSYSVHIEN